MLSELHIRNFALIERLDLDFRPGLNILTGETGAGKSILIDAINALLGERTGTEVIRSGTDRASVEGAFTPDGAAAVTEILAGEGLDDGDDIILGRELSRTSQGAARVNGRRTTIGVLRVIGEGLVDLHGQHDHQSLLNTDRHVDILDAWAGPRLAEVRGRVEDIFHRWKNCQAELSALQMDARERERRIDLYRFQIAEIDAARPREDEEEGLLAERTRFAGAEKLAASVGEASGLLTGDANAAVESLGAAVSRLRDAVRIDPSIQPLLEAVEGAYYSIQEAGRDVAGYVDSIEFNPTRLAEVEERIDLLRRLKKKYGDTIADVLAHRDSTARELAAIEGVEARTEELEGEIYARRTELDALNSELRTLRREAGESLHRAMEQELTELAMEKTQVAVSVEPAELSANGADRVEFLISPNPGEPLKPLARIASGGELSRLMLALKSVVAKADPVPVLIFDEIDTGVSGRQAAVIARKMRALARESQVLCVTHLPQIAAAADHHYLIRKGEENGRTVTQVEVLEPEFRIEEIARMLAGDAPTPSARANARDLIAESTRG
ncbi:MAG TPA: DNA repair protein RecN [Armatimonadota bacterium]|jgi:DNA repair protein RecN (Recombination protein N)